MEYAKTLIPLLSEVAKKLIERYRISPQSHGMHSRPSWVSLDPLWADIFCRKMTPEYVAVMKRGMERTLQDPDAWFNETKQEITTSAITRPSKEFLRHTIVAGRDELAVRGLLFHLPSHPLIASVWGALHLLGMSKLLTQDGFQISNIKWLPYFPAAL